MKLTYNIYRNRPYGAEEKKEIKEEKEEGI